MAVATFLWHNIQTETEAAQWEHVTRWPQGRNTDDTALDWQTLQIICFFRRWFSANKDAFSVKKKALVTKIGTASYFVWSKIETELKCHIYMVPVWTKTGTASYAVWSNVDTEWKCHIYMVPVSGLSLTITHEASKRFISNGAIDYHKVKWTSTYRL